jgi:hypothetical protein
LRGSVGFADDRIPRCSRAVAGDRVGDNGIVEIGAIAALAALHL